MEHLKYDLQWQNPACGFKPVVSADTEKRAHLHSRAVLNEPGSPLEAS